MPASDYIVCCCKKCDGYVYGCVAMNEYFDAKESAIVATYAIKGHTVDIIDRDRFKICDCPGEITIT